mgnify:CR=1 FL=1
MMEFDERLARAAGALPPQEGELREFSPFGFCVLYIVAGLALTTIHLNFFGLQYLLPMVGHVCLYLGFRTLRRENRWYRFCFWVAAAWLVIQWASLLVLATPLAQQMQSLTFSPASLIPLLFYYCFHRGLTASWEKTGREMEGAPMVGAILWYLAALGLSLFGGSLPAALIMLVCYVLVLRSLWRAGERLEAVGYTLEAAPVRLSKRAVWLGVLVLTLVPVVVLSVCFTRPVLDASVRPAEEQAGQEVLREELEALGFPQAILNDLSPQDLEGFAGTVQVEVCGGLKEDSNAWREPDGSLELMTVYTWQSDNRMRILHWFRWLEAPMLRMGEGLSCNLPDTVSERGWDWVSPPSGRLLWERGDTTMTAPFHVLSAQMDTANSFFGENTYPRLTARFSYPLWADRFRGYVVYDYTSFPGDFDGLSLNYYHQRTLLCYPWQLPRGGWLGGGIFRNYQDYSNLVSLEEAATWSWPDDPYVPQP